MGDKRKNALLDPVIPLPKEIPSSSGALELQNDVTVFHVCTNANATVYVLPRPSVPIALHVYYWENFANSGSLTSIQLGAIKYTFSYQLLCRRGRR